MCENSSMISTRAYLMSLVSRSGTCDRLCDKKVVLINMHQDRDHLSCAYLKFPFWNSCYFTYTCNIYACVLFGGYRKVFLFQRAYAIRTFTNMGFWWINVTLEETFGVNKDNANFKWVCECFHPLVFCAENKDYGYSKISRISC